MMDDDFGFSMVDPTESKINSQRNTLISRLIRVRQAIEPFLDNLAMNPEKDIHWPDRDVKIAAFKQKLWDIMEGKDER